MADEAGYSRQIMPQPVARRPAPSPQAFGAGLGQALEQAGAQGHREQLQSFAIERQETRNQQWTSFLHDYGQFQEQMTATALEARKAAGTDHAQKMGEAWEAGRDKLLSGITEDQVRRQASQMFDEGATHFVTNELTFQTANDATNTVVNFEGQRNVVANRVRRMTNPDDYLAAVKQQTQAVAGLDVDEPTKLKLLPETQNLLASSYIRGQIDRDPEAAKALLGSGAFDDVLKNDELQTLTRSADVEIRSRQVAARSQLALAKHALDDQVNTVLKEVNAGGIVDPDILTGLQKQGGALGLDHSQMYDITAGIARNDVNREFRNATPEAIAGEKAAVDAKLATQKTQDPALVERSKALGQLLPNRREAIAKDPLTWAAQNGLKVAPFSLAASDSDIQSWVTAGDAAAKASGIPPGNVKYLPQDGAAQLATIASSGKAGALEALDFASRFGGTKAIAVARQIRPNDEGFAWLTQLAPPVRGLALSGQEAIKGNPKILSYSKVDFADLANTSDEQDKEFAQATIGMDERQKQAVRSTFGRIYAGLVSEGHDLHDPAARWQALNWALGAQGTPGEEQKGGIAAWGGGYYVVPSTMTRGQFQQRIRGAWSHDGPVNPNGTPASLSAAVPRRIGATRYYFVNQAGQPFRKADGSVFAVDVGQ